ncbi:MAG: hypothetical protein AB7P21_25690 [Lautropia sp.]
MKPDEDTRVPTPGGGRRPSPERDDPVRQSPPNGSQTPADRASEGTPGAEPEPTPEGERAHDDAESERVDTSWAPATDDTYRRVKKGS